MMAWKWLSKLELNGKTYNFIVPPFTFSYSLWNNFTATLSAYEGQSTYANALLAASSMLAQETVYDFTQTTSPAYYTVAGQGGLRIYQSSGAYPNSFSQTWTYYSIIFNQKGSFVTSSANFSSYNMEQIKLGLCAVYDDDQEMLFVGNASAYIYIDNQNRRNCVASVTVFSGSPYDWNLYNELKAGIVPDTPSGSDPYEAGGYSDTTPSSSGDFDDASDSISVPSLPSISALGAGAISLAVISEAELGNFMNYIMNPSFTGLSSISRFFSDPIQAIACLNYMPYTPTNTSGYTLSWGGDDTGASVGAVSAQYEEIDCGSVDLTEFYGSCLDYSPYTTVQLVLPFAGSVDIDPDEFNGKTISVKYHIDNYTGAGLALVSDGDRVLLQVPCSVSNPVPLTSADYSAIIASIANVVMGGVSTIAAVYTGGASVGASVALAGGFAASAAGNVMSAKLHFNHGGSMGMGTGMFGVLKPYLIIKRPRQCLPEQNGSFQGYPTFVTENLGDLSGFTKIAEIHLDSIPVTTAERAELMAILKGGVIF